MKIKLLSLLMLGCCALNACAKTVTDKTNAVENQNASAAKIETVSATVAPENRSTENSNNPESQTKQPRTVRDFFNLLPQKYFLLEGCEPAKDKNCERARSEYVKTFLETEDTANGFWKSGCDGAQSCLTLALFKRPDTTYVVAVHTIQEAEETNYFLEYNNGKWSDISRQIVPEFSDKNIYELPQKGTTVAVYKKNFPEPDWSERGAKIYELIWKDGKFQRQK